MGRANRRRLVVIVAVVVAVAATALTVELTRSDTASTHPSIGVASDTAATITTSGASLAAEVITPKGSGPFPLIVMPASWGGVATIYRAIGLQFADAGYQIVAYAQRGFGGSSGLVDFAGPSTQRDASAVITWALAHTKANRHEIGVFGTSYGAGIGLLAAAHDPRIKAVGALSTWVSISDSFDVNATPSTAALRTLIGSPRPTYDQTVQELRATLADRSAAIGAQLRQLSPSRSPGTYVSDLNRNDPAIFIANAFEDSLFNPAQLIPFFTALTTPKRLELAGGDHGGPERSALSGTPNATVADVRLWFDHFLRGIANGIDQQDPIVLKDVRTHGAFTYTSWPVATAADRVPLGRPGSEPPAQYNAATTWSASILAGTDTTATSGPMQFVPSSDYRPPTLNMQTVNTASAFVWTGPTLRAGLGVRGSPMVQVLLSASAPTVTLFLYLYDVAPDGVGTLIDMQPYTTTGLSAAAAKQADVALQPICWSLPSNDHLALVIDTVDPRYASLTPAGTTITISSTNTQPATFSSPTSA